MATNILIVEDSKVVRAQLLDTLRSVDLFDNYYEAGNGLEGLKILATTPIDFVLCDLMMPRMDGFQFLAAVRKKEEFLHIPVIILSERGESKTKVKGLGIGARDYITKPFDPAELIARIMVQLNIKSLQDEMRKTNELLKEISITDHLTHLYNRRYMMDELAMEFHRSSRKKGDLCLVLIDVDHFKLVNDTYGHQNGDMVLAAIAETIQVELRRYDLAARYGGEEFAMVLPDATLHQGCTVAERLRQTVLDITFPPPMENLAVTVSQGIAALPSPRINSVDALIKAADDALYRAKQNGRNRIETMMSPA
jgi:two-component system cell cycle response regulator